MPTIFDNIDHQLVNELNQKLEKTQRADFCVGYFNLRGWKAIDKAIDTWTGNPQNCCRIIVGMQRMPKAELQQYFQHSRNTWIDNKTAKQLKRKLAAEFREQLTIGIPTNRDEKGLQTLSKQLKANKVQVKLFLRHTLHAKLYLLFLKQSEVIPRIGYMGSSNLTFSGLSNQGELNIDVWDKDATHKLAEWFEERWEDRWSLDITTELAEIIDESWAGEHLIPPYYIYLKIAYHLSREAREGISDYTVPKIFRKLLLDFQQKAVLVAAHHLHKRGGVMIGDVVGLGKTFTGTALCKLFQDDFGLETLIICPKNLTGMWEKYVHTYRLIATKVLPISEAQKKLATLRRYRLILIDESHNLRNRDGKRYKAIQEYIQLNGSKVILLTATPYNKTYLDLSNQLRLFIKEEEDLGIRPEAYIRAIGGIVEFKKNHPQTPVRSILAFEKSDYGEDWRELMRLFLVRRTRSFIKNNYADTDSTNNRKYLKFSDGTRSYFPTRFPKKVEYPFNEDDATDQYAKLYSESVVDIINDLYLPRYGLRLYLAKLPKLAPTAAETVIQQNLSRAGRRLMGFSRTNLFKRLESSGYSFLLSLSRHALRNFIFIHALSNNLPLPIGSQEAALLDEFIEFDDFVKKTTTSKMKSLLLKKSDYLAAAAKIYQYIQTEKEQRFKWIRSGFFSKKLKKHLQIDSDNILKILNLGKAWQPESDRQLNALYDLLMVTHKTEKILIFTQYADTAKYLYQTLTNKGVTKLEIATGETKNPTVLAGRFSPISNEVEDTITPEEELRILIATDVLSEGQNLQDAHIVLNYDLPWAIIRLIQRAGRVDRIGQQSEKIYCYSFLPEAGIERIIRLRNRLTNRLRENAETVGADEVFFTGDTVNIYDIYTEKSGILDQEEDEDIDLASRAYEIWRSAINANPKLKKIIPNKANVIYANKTASTKQQKGILVYTRTARGNDVLTWVNTKGELVTQSQLTILKAAECSIDTPALLRTKHHHDLVEKGLTLVKDLEITIGGQLGRKTSAKYRTYTILKNYIATHKNTLFEINPKLEKALDDLFKYPLRANATEKLNRQLRAGIPDDKLAELVLALWENDLLSVIHEVAATEQGPQIICSMGLL